MPEGPFEDEHILYNFFGAMPSGEQWSIGLRTVTAVIVLSDLSNFAGDAHTRFKTFWTAAGSVADNNPPAVTYSGCTARLIKTDGTTAFVANGFSGAAVPGDGQHGAPNQSALVVSLRTARAGRNARGRCYLPLLAPVFQDGTDLLTAAQVTPILSAFTTFVDAINTISSGTAGPFPIAVQSRATPPTFNEVTQIAIGNVVDTQRRRRNKVTETYQVLAIT